MKMSLWAELCGFRHPIGVLLLMADETLHIAGKGSED